MTNVNYAFEIDQLKQVGFLVRLDKFPSEFQVVGKNILELGWMVGSMILA